LETNQPRGLCFLAVERSYRWLYDDEDDPELAYQQFLRSPSGVAFEPELAEFVDPAYDTLAMEKIELDEEDVRVVDDIELGMPNLGNLAPSTATGASSALSEEDRTTVVLFAVPSPLRRDRGRRLHGKESRYRHRHRESSPRVRGTFVVHRKRVG